MALVMPCQLCGESLPPLSDDDEKLLRGGKPVVLKHSVCPRDEAAVEAARPRLRRFEARVTIVEVIAPEPAAPAHSGLIVPGVFQPTAPLTQTAEVVELAGFVAFADGPSLVESMRPLAHALGEKWMQVETNAPLVDTPDLADLADVPVELAEGIREVGP